MNEPINNQTEEVKNDTVNTPSTEVTATEAPTTEAPKSVPTTEAPAVVPGPATPTQVAEKPHQPKVEEQVIYNIKQEKGGNILGVLIFFAIIFAAVYYLPDIYKNIGKYIPALGSKEIEMKPLDPNNTPKEEPEKPVENEIEIYKLNTNANDAKIDDLTFGNFIKTEEGNKYILKFYIINSSDSTFTFDNTTKFYLDLYQDNNYLKSLLVYSYEPILAKATKEVSFELSKEVYTKFNGFSVVRKSSTDIPDVELKETEGDYKILKCKNNITTTKYFFINNYLEKIEDNYTESINELTYTEDLEYYRNLGTSYEEINGMEPFIVETNEGFTFTVKLNLFDMNDSDVYKLANYKFFNFHKESKEIYFEMTALGYTCS